MEVDEQISALQSKKEICQGELRQSAGSWPRPFCSSISYTAWRFRHANRGCRNEEILASEIFPINDREVFEVLEFTGIDIKNERNGDIDFEFSDRRKKTWLSVTIQYSKSTRTTYLKVPMIYLETWSEGLENCCQLTVLNGLCSTVFSEGQWSCSFPWTQEFLSTTGLELEAGLAENVGRRSQTFFNTDVVAEATKVCLLLVSICQWSLW